MSAELLSRAAKVLRERAEESQNKRPWCSEYTWSAVRHVQRNCDIECERHGADLGAECWSFDMYDGRYVALMHPPVALALAEMLEDIVKIGKIQHLGPPSRAVVVARAILREPS